MEKTTSFITLMILILFVFIFGCSSGTDSYGNTVAIFEGGYRYNAEKLHVVQLNGDCRQMGRQYGYLLKSQIQSYYQKAINEHPPWGGNWSRENAEDFAMGNYANYPDRGKERLNGMAETSGLSMDQLVLIDQYTELFVVSEVFGCSSMAVWGDYTADGSVVQARNEDMPEVSRSSMTALSL